MAINEYIGDVAVGIWQNIERGMPDLYKTAMGLNPTGRMGTPQGVAAGEADIGKSSPSGKCKSDVGLGRRKRTFGVCDRPFQPPWRDGTDDLMPHSVPARRLRRVHVGYAGRIGTFVLLSAFVTCWSRFRCTFRSSGGVKAIHCSNDRSA